MKFALVIPMMILATASFTYAQDNSKGGAEAESTTSTSHNPLTKTTTTTVKKSAKRHYKSGSDKSMGEDTVKVEKKVKDDGSKTSVTTETTHTEENK